MSKQQSIKFQYLIDKFYQEGLSPSECLEYGYLVTGNYIHLTPESHL